MQADFLSQIRDELTSFSQDLDSKTRTLLDQRLISIEELERLKKSASVYTEYLDRALRDSSLASTQKPLIEAYVKDYKLRMTQELEKFWGRLYSDTNVKKEFKKAIDHCMAQLAQEYNQENRKALIEQLKMLENHLWNKFKSELKNRGESQRYKVAEEILEELLENLKSITGENNSKFLPSNEIIDLGLPSENEPHIPGETIHINGVKKKKCEGERVKTYLGYLGKTIRRSVRRVVNPSRSNP
jgi:Rad3-related DNA helicase